MCRLKQFHEITRSQVTVAKNVMQQSGSDSLARMHRDHRRSAVFMPKKVVAAFDSDNNKTNIPQRGH
jgi:hypothetical protein